MHLSRPAARWLFPVLALVLAGCNSNDDRAAAGGDLPPPPPASLSGSVVKGVTANAIVTVLGSDGAGGFTLLGTTTTDAQGAYGLTLPSGFSGAVQLLVTASTDPANPTLMRCDAVPDCGLHPDGSTGDLNDDGVVDFGEFAPVGPDFALRAVVAIDAAGPRIVNVTPLSTLAADWAAQFPQGIDPDSADAANARVAALFGFALEDMESGISDIADPLWVNLANPEQVRLSLLLATFSQIARTYDIDAQEVIEYLSSLFAAQQGRLLEASDSIEQPSIDLFHQVSQTILLAGVVELPPATAEQVSQALDSARAALEHGVMAGGMDAREALDTVLARLGPMGAQIDELLELTGLYDPLAVVESQLPQFDWLFTPENLQILPLVLETVGQAIVGSLMLDMPGLPDTQQLSGDEWSSVTLDRAAKTLTVSGLRYGQMADITIDLTGLRSGLVAKSMRFGVDGSVVNTVSAGRIEGELDIDLSGTDTAPLVAAIDALLATEETAGQQLLAALYGLAYGLDAGVAVTGSASLANVEAPAQLLGIAGSLTASLDLGALPGETIATLDIPAGRIDLPNGDVLQGIEGTPVLSVVVADDASLVLAGEATFASVNLPRATAHAEGTLENARAVVEHVRATLVGAVAGGSVDLSGLLASLLDFDWSLLAIQGEGTIEIPELEHQYRARLDNLTGTLYQPWSDQAAATATLDLDQPGIDLVLGGEPWAVTLVTTPTPRVLLLGPQGQFAEASQEDLYSLLQALPLADLFAGLFGTGSGDTDAEEPVYEDPVILL